MKYFSYYHEIYIHVHLDIVSVQRFDSLSGV